MHPDSENPNADIANAPEQAKRLSSTGERVGYRRPPQANQFKKGVSGNPKGRPKGSLNVATIFMRAAREKVVVNENGRRKTVTKLEAALKQLVNKSAAGELRALQQSIALANDAEEKQNAAAATQSSALSESDQEVLEGILKRFDASGDYSLEAPDEDQSE
jgi:hypothetical protein